MQKTIYVKDQAEWDLIKGRAESAGQTVSRYLLGGVSQLDRIEKKLDLLIPKGMPVGEGRIVNAVGKDSIRDYSVGGKDEQTEIKVGFEDSGEKTIKEKKIELVKGRDLSPKISSVDEKMLKKAQGVIDKKKPESLTGWTGGFSKEQQTGKKAKRGKQ